MTTLHNQWALREVWFDEDGNPTMHREPVVEPSQAASDAYDRIDHFLRNNLYDDDYADYSFDLDLIWGAAPQPAKREPLTREQAMAIVQSNPDTMTAIRMTEAAHGITGETK